MVYLPPPGHPSITSIHTLIAPKCYIRHVIHNQILACLLWTLLVKILTVFAGTQSHNFQQVLVFDGAIQQAEYWTPPALLLRKIRTRWPAKSPRQDTRSPQAGPGDTTCHTPTSHQCRHRPVFTPRQDNRVKWSKWKCFLWKLLSPEHQKSE